MYISITGLTVKSWLQSPTFWWHAIRSMRQARQADGNLSAESRTINGVHHTVSAWRDEAAMKAYLTTGAHLSALKVFKKIAKGKTLGFQSDVIPNWSNVHDLWRTQGRDV